MQYLLITLILVLSLTGCQDKKQIDEAAQAKHDAKTAQEARAEVLAELQAEKLKVEKLQTKQLQISKAQKEATPTSPPVAMDPKNTQLNQMGINMEENSITIDTNKTKAFFNDLSTRLEVQMKKISDDLKKGILDTKEAGVEINDKHIHIDLNRTHNMLQDWGKKIQIFVEEFDELTNNIENNATN